MKVHAGDGIARRCDEEAGGAARRAFNETGCCCLARVAKFFRGRMAGLEKEHDVHHSRP